MRQKCLTYFPKDKGDPKSQNESPKAETQTEPFFMGPFSIRWQNCKLGFDDRFVVVVGNNSMVEGMRFVALFVNIRDSKQRLFHFSIRASKQRLFNFMRGRFNLRWPDRLIEIDRTIELRLSNFR